MPGIRLQAAMIRSPCTTPRVAIHVASLRAHSALAAAALWPAQPLSVTLSQPLDEYRSDADLNVATVIGGFN